MGYTMSISDNSNEMGRPEVASPPLPSARARRGGYQHVNLQSPASSRANRAFWDDDAESYHARHKNYLDGFYWSPEMLSEEHAQLLGDVSGQSVLEIGCGSAPCATWLTEKAPAARLVTGIDLSMGMLSQSAKNVPLVQADALRLPFCNESFDQVFSAFGAIPFIEDLTLLFAEIRRVLTPGGRLTYSCNHPMRWVFPDDPGEAGLVAEIPYFERRYEEVDASGEVSYAEFQHTIGDHVAALANNQFHITKVLEPEWPEGLEENWGQWSPLRGRIFPGTIIFQATAL